MAVRFFCDRCAQEFDPKDLNAPYYTSGMGMQYPIKNEDVQLHLCNECVEDLKAWIRRPVRRRRKPAAPPEGSFFLDPNAPTAEQHDPRGHEEPKVETTLDRIHDSMQEAALRDAERRRILYEESQRMWGIEH